MYKRLASVLWLCAAPLFAQMQMQDMPMEKPSSPVPQLLQGVASRAPLKLQDFLAMADRNNPTLQQAAAYFVEWTVTGLVIGVIYRPPAPH